MDYDRFYAARGWQYDGESQTRSLRLVADRAGWKRGDVVYEIGAGMGFHANILVDAGYQVTAVEVSRVGADHARQQYPDVAVVCADVAAWTPPAKGHVYARGMSWWHYELDGVNCQGVDVPAETARLFDDVVDGTFVLQIVTDLSGRRETPKVHQNRVADYERLFSKHGAVEIMDWSGESARTGLDRGVVVICRPC